MSKTQGFQEDKKLLKRYISSRYRDLDSSKQKYTESDLLNDRVVKDVLMPKFEMFGLGKILRVSFEINYLVCLLDHIPDRC